ncbi:MAG TPA: phosphoribosylamine--glycine ligase [Candidatus Binatia bacterium]|nr:phosphoribosylamine--glycine ligase [Candidatus Binatia bacterium]
MKVLLVGGGGREHALAWKMAGSPRLGTLLAAPGNPGIARHARCVPIKDDAIEDLLDLARREGVDLTVVGPELPLSLGLADRFRAAGLPVLGPSASAARIESSKVFAKELMARHGVPTARFAVFRDVGRARAFCREIGAPLVVKADGLAGGKGVIVCQTLAEADRALSACLEERRFGPAGLTVVVEEFLRGEEASLFVLTDGRDAISLGVAQDHKTVYDGDQGPNTGGMGAYAPTPLLPSAAADEVMAAVVRPVLSAMAAEGAPYAGILFVGLMLTDGGPRVIEFNCRFGDPEAQALLPLLDEDCLALFEATASGTGLPARLRWAPAVSVCVVMASAGYPGGHGRGRAIDGVEAAEGLPGVRVFQAGTALREGRLVTAGGRVLGVQATGADLAGAIAAAYAGVDRIRFEGAHYRRDIGRRAQVRVGRG